MKFIIILSALAMAVAGCNGPVKKEVADNTPAVTALPEKKKDTASFTSIQWIDSVKDYGKIAEGQKLEVLYRFKNTGTKPLVIESVHPSCGCTVADPPKEPIAPGAEGEIKGSFDSNGKSGQQHKTINVTANTKGSENHELSFTVDVQKKSS
ncbi:MAG: DUF1573 domain-containing protein [Chitinophagaceae bacterium]